MRSCEQSFCSARETTRQILIHSQRGRCPVARAFITVRIRITYGVCTRTCLRFGVVNHRKPQQFADASVGAEREQTQKLAEAAKSGSRSTGCQISHSGREIKFRYIQNQSHPC